MGNNGSASGRRKNYTAPANKLNDENIIVIGDVHESRPEALAAQGRPAACARDEIRRIIARHGQRI